MTAEIIDGTAIAGEILTELRPRVETLRARAVAPGLASVLVRERPASPPQASANPDSNAHACSHSCPYPYSDPVPSPDIDDRAGQAGGCAGKN